MKNWLQAASALGLITLCFTTSAQPITLATKFQHIPFGVGIGATGLQAADLDGDGRDEIVAAATTGTGFAPNNFWYVLERRGAGLEMRFVSTLYDPPISAIRLANVAGSARPEIIVAAGNTIYVYDSCDCREIGRLATVAEPIWGLNIADVDRDGTLEYVFVNDTALYIYSVATGALRYQSAAYRGVDVAVGNVDTDSDLEIVVATGDNSPGYVLNGRTRALEWNHPNGFGSQVRVGDVNPNLPGSEIVARRRWGAITVLNAFVRSPLNEYSSFNNAALKIADVNRDGRLDIVHGDAQWGRVYVRNGETLALLGSFVNPEHGVTDIAIADTDGDRTNEVLWGAGYTSTGPDHLFIGDIETYSIAWRSDDLVGPFSAIAAADLTGDGVAELLYSSSSSNSGYRGGVLFVRDTRTWGVLYRTNPETSFSSRLRMALANVDSDPQPEIFLSETRSYRSFVECYDGQTFELQYRAGGTEGSATLGIQVADLNRDGAPELVLSTGRSTTGAPGVYVEVYDARTGAFLWRSVNLGLRYWASLPYLRVGNIDRDPALEIVVGEENGQIVIYDGVTRLQQLATASQAVSALELADLNADGVLEVLVGTETGALYVLNPTTGGISQSLGSYGGRINGLQVADLLGTPAQDLIFCVEGVLHVRYIHPATGQPVVWRSASLGDTAGYSDSLRVVDFENDGRAEIVLNVGYGLKVLRLVLSIPTGDVNRDGCVDDADLLQVLCAFGETGANPADLNRDGLVDDQDLLLVLFHFGAGC